MTGILKRFLKKEFEAQDNEVMAVVDGVLISIRDVPDKVFSQNMLGEGIAIMPEGNHVTAPADGSVSMIFPTGHAFGMTLKNGMEILVHIGLDTVALNGQGFQVCVAEGSAVKRGDEIIRIDRDYILKQGYNPVIIMIFADTKGQQLDLKTSGKVYEGRSVVALYKAAE